MAEEQRQQLRRTCFAWCSHAGQANWAQPLPCICELLASQVQCLLSHNASELSPSYCATLTRQQHAGQVQQVVQPPNALLAQRVCGEGRGAEGGVRADHAHAVHEQELQRRRKLNGC